MATPGQPENTQSHNSIPLLPSSFPSSLLLFTVTSLFLPFLLFPLFLFTDRSVPSLSLCSFLAFPLYLYISLFSDHGMYWPQGYSLIVNSPLENVLMMADSIPYEYMS